ncbi:hypothetical protein [Reticulibacter mediterranei]|uniref:hypothetical protein n=1 Tax=Reticulibacter mediterranei TaxID=2778369 RepID=UPI001C68DE70|nr:hypothetical protein [Reticulibacter mediterranei]
MHTEKHGEPHSERSCGEGADDTDDRPTPEEPFRGLKDLLPLYIAVGKSLAATAVELVEPHEQREIPTHRYAHHKDGVPGRDPAEASYDEPRLHLHQIQEQQVLADVEDGPTVGETTGFPEGWWSYRQALEHRGYCFSKEAPGTLRHDPQHAEHDPQNADQEENDREPRHQEADPALGRPRPEPIARLLSDRAFHCSAPFTLELLTPSAFLLSCSFTS